MVYSQSSPPLEKEGLTGEGPLLGGRGHDFDARSERRGYISPNKPSLRSPLSSLKNGHVSRDRPSISRRIFRALTRFLVAVLVGVGATLGWQSYGDAAREVLAAQAPALSKLLPVLTTKSPVVTATSPDPMLQLAPLASNVDVVRRSLEQLAAKQEQIVQDIAALRAGNEGIRQMLSSPQPQQPASTPQPKPVQPRAQLPAVQSSSVPRRPPATTSPSR
jgi:hypothetical protein